MIGYICEGSKKTSFTMKNIRTALIQQSNGADISANIQKLEHNIRQAAQEGAQLVVLQELHNSRYFCQTEDTAVFDLAESIPGPSTDRFGSLAKELGLVIVTSLFEKRAPGLYHNTAVVFEKDGSIAGKYRKMHIPDDPAYYEKFYFTPGDMGFEPIQTSVGKLGVLVCWDQWYPEAARLMALRGADLLIYPTAIGWESSDSADEKARQKDAWVISQRAHAVANGLPVVSVNRVGHEPDPSGITNGIQFWGNSFVAGPQGEFLQQAGNHDEALLMADIDLQRSESVRRIWPFLRDRRIDAYGNIVKRYLD
jgi:N-carbamoylputrescine amidase